MASSASFQGLEGSAGTSTHDNHHGQTASRDHPGDPDNPSAVLLRTAAKTHDNLMARLVSHGHPKVHDNPTAVSLRAFSSDTRQYYYCEIAFDLQRPSPSLAVATCSHRRSQIDQRYPRGFAVVNTSHLRFAPDADVSTLRFGEPSRFCQCFVLYLLTSAGVQNETLDYVCCRSTNGSKSITQGRMEIPVVYLKICLHSSPDDRLALDIDSTFHQRVLGEHQRVEMLKRDRQCEV